MNTTKRERKSNEIKLGLNFEKWLDRRVKDGYYSKTTRHSYLKKLKGCDLSSVGALMTFLSNKRISQQKVKRTYNNYISVLKIFNKSLLEVDPNNEFIDVIENLKPIKTDDRMIYYSLPWDTYLKLSKFYPREFTSLSEYVKILVLKYLQQGSIFSDLMIPNDKQEPNCQPTILLSELHELSISTRKLSSSILKLNSVISSRIKKSNKISEVEIS